MCVNPEEEWRKGSRHDEHDGHSDKRDGTEGVHRRVNCDNQDTYADEHDEWRKDDRLAELRQDSFAGPMFVQ